MNPLSKVVKEVADAFDEVEEPSILTTVISANLDSDLVKGPLKDCPFDLGLAEALRKDGAKFPFFIRCTKCLSTSTQYKTLDLAVLGWNRREKRRRKNVAP